MFSECSLNSTATEYERAEVGLLSNANQAVRTKHQKDPRRMYIVPVLHP